MKNPERQDQSKPSPRPHEPLIPDAPGEKGPKTTQTSNSKSDQKSRIYPNPSCECKRNDCSAHAICQILVQYAQMCKEQKGEEAHNARQ